MSEPICDNARYLICRSYSIPALHQLANDLHIGRHWFHPGRLAHYDIPKLREADITAHCTVVTSRELIAIIHTRRGPKSDPTL